MNVAKRATHELFASVEAMLAPSAFSQLLQQPVSKIQRRPVVQKLGHSHNPLEQIEVDGNDDQRYFLKRINRARDWLMHSSNDYLCRSVTLWQYGLLGQMPPEIDHAVVACSYDGDGWAILMRDVAEGLSSELLKLQQVFFLLDAMAAIHAIYWNSDDLLDPRLGLCNTSDMTNMVSLAAASQPSQVPSVVQSWILEGWSFLQDRLASDVVDALQALMADPTPLHQATDRYPTTLIHGDFRPGAGGNVGVMPGKLGRSVVIDWQLAGRSLMTIDLAWFVNNEQVSLVIRPDEASAYYRQRLESRLGQQFETSYWQAMLDLGMLSNVLRQAHFKAYWDQYEPDDTKRALRQTTLAYYNDHVRAGLKWL